MLEGYLTICYLWEQTGILTWVQEILVKAISHPVIEVLIIPKLIFHLSICNRPSILGYYVCGTKKT